MDRRRDIAKRIDMFGQWGDVTLLFQEQNGQPGLQVYLPTESAKKQSGLQLIQGDVDLESGTWISAPIIPNTILVNVGLTLEGMTDGLCKANVHRVIFQGSASAELPKGRKTIAYFSTPNHDIVMNPVKPGGIIVQKDGASSVGEFFQERVQLAGIA
uniref:Isopenicillin N synthase-like Fe(2+) 2OG dioxygenase domain-containing protein n=1 Tax=Bionectria ochroleuca TaxID=29856 RepID=A0A8H7N433_BIOOC